MKEVDNKNQWDRKKILLFLLACLFLVGLGYALKTILLGQSTKAQNPPSYQTGQEQAVKGASSQSFSSSPNIKKSVQDQINNLKKEALDINVVDIATSSPQVQKVINDLKSLQDYPKNQLKNACEKICSGI